MEDVRKHTDKDLSKLFYGLGSITQLGLQNLPFSYDWVFFLYTDECLTAELGLEIINTVNTSNQSFEGYYIKRNFYFLGRWLVGIKLREKARQNRFLTAVVKVVA